MIRKGKLCLSALCIFFSIVFFLTGCGTKDTGGNKSTQTSENTNDLSDKTGEGNNTEDNNGGEDDSEIIELPPSDISSGTLNVSLTPPQELLDDPVAIAAALSKSDTVNLGVWSLINALGIGVYTGQGVQVMNGSERDSKDFYLYDFLVPRLADMALMSPYPFSEYHARMARIGLPVSSSEFLTQYRDMYNAAENKDAFLVRLFKEWNTSFDDEDPEITPLQEFLLMLAFLPETIEPNSSGMNETTSLGKIAASSNPCDWINPVLKDPAFKLGQNSTGLLLDAIVKEYGLKHIALKAIPPLQMAQSLINAGILQFGAETKLKKSGDTHYTNCPVEPSPDVKLTANASFNWDMPDLLVSCGPLAGLDFMKKGGIPDMAVTWDIKPLCNHGLIQPLIVPDMELGSSGKIATKTNINGETYLTLKPNPVLSDSSANGKGTIQFDEVEVTASFNIQGAGINGIPGGEEAAIALVVGLAGDLLGETNEKSEIVKVGRHTGKGYRGTLNWVIPYSPPPSLDEEGTPYCSPSDNMDSLDGAGAAKVSISLDTCNYPEGPWNVKFTLSTDLYEGYYEVRYTFEHSDNHNIIVVNGEDAFDKFTNSNESSGYELIESCYYIGCYNSVHSDYSGDASQIYLHGSQMCNLEDTFTAENSPSLIITGTLDNGQVVKENTHVYLTTTEDKTGRMANVVLNSYSYSSRGGYSVCSEGPLGDIGPVSGGAFKYFEIPPIPLEEYNCY